MQCCGGSGARYFSEVRNGDTERQYAQKFISDDGKQNGLYWPVAAGLPPSPLEDVRDFAKAAGYTNAGDKPQPFDGYYFRFLTKQGDKAKGGAKDYLVNGKLTGGFAILAYPADYRNSGIMTFIVGKDGVVYQKDLGEKTRRCRFRLDGIQPWRRLESCDLAKARGAYVLKRRLSDVQPDRSLIRPYRGTLLIILIAMLVQTAMSVAGPWPLKIILDNVVGSHKLSPEMTHLLGPLLRGEGKMKIAEAAAIAAVLIALIGATMSYIANYLTTSVGQWVANDLRLKTYHHLQQLSLSYYDSHETGTLLSTVTADVQTIQGFASSSTLGIIVDMFTIVAMLIVMLWLNWDFTLIAVAVTPFMLLLVSRFKKTVKKATHQVRKEQSKIVEVAEQGLQSMRVTKAFGRQDLAEAQFAQVSQATVNASLKARRIKALLSPIVAVTVSLFTAFVLYRGSSLILAGAMTAGGLTVFLSYLSKFFKPVSGSRHDGRTRSPPAAVGVDSRSRHSRC